MSKTAHCLRSFHEVSLAGAIGRPRLSVTCLNKAAMFIAADVRFEAQSGLKRDRAMSEMCQHRK